MKKLSIYLIFITSGQNLLFSMNSENTQIPQIKGAAYYFYDTWQAGDKTFSQLKYYNN